VDDASLAASSPAVAADAAGNVYALWLDNRRGDADVYFAKRSSATGTWSASVRVNDDAAGSTQASPVIAVAPSGEAIAIWVDGRSKKKHIYSAWLPAGGSIWSANIRVTSDQNNTKAAPDIAIDGNGVAYAVWGQQGQVWGLWFSSLPIGAGAWASPTQLGSTSQALTLPQITADSTGRLIAVYLQAPTIWVQDRPVGSTWSTAVVAGTSGTVGTLDVAYQPGGKAFAVWDTNGQLVGRWFDPSNRVWGAIQNLTSSGTHGTASVALTASQTVVVSTDGTGTAADIKAYVLPTP
jgi:hypothetical protein